MRESGQSSATVGSPIQLYFPVNCMHLFDANDDVAARRTIGENVPSQPMVAGVTVSRAARGNRN